MMACILMISATFFTSCGDDGTNESPNPISELVFPESDADNPIRAGQLVQIGGKGFADDCNVWLQGAGDDEVETEITVSAEGISFIAPNISGEYTVVLEQGDGTYVLGSLFFAEKRPSVFTGKRVTKISAPYGANDYETYDYSDGNLIKFSDDSEDDDGGRRVYNLAYIGNQVKVRAVYNNGDTEEYLYTLNAEGYAVSAITTATDELERYTATQLFEYENGYLVKIVSKDNERKNTIQIKYTNGNAISYSVKEVGDEEPLDYTSTYTYSETLNKGGVLPLDDNWLDAGGSYGYLSIAYYAGILGKPTTNLVKANGSRSYEYEMKDGYVEKCTVMSNGTIREVSSYSFE